MQDRYVGDLGDFGKYGLLRGVCSTFRIGIVWHLTSDETKNGNGKHTAYLQEGRRGGEALAKCDCGLYDRLRDIVNGRMRRHVGEIRASGLFPADTVFFEDALDFRNVAVGDRLRIREEWSRRALAATLQCDIVFFDPDNGLEVASAPPHSLRSPKYAFYDDLLDYRQRGQSLIVYQHISRSRGGGGAHEQIRRRLKDFERHLASNAGYALLYKRGTARAFLILPAPIHETAIAEGVQDFVDGPWGIEGHFQLVTPETNCDPQS